MSDRFKKIEGQRFGRLVAISPTEKRDTNGSVIWKCKCDCGNIAEVSAKSLTAESGRNTRSCGCVLKDYQRTKGAQILREEVKKDCVEGTKIHSLSMKTFINNTSGIKGVTWDKRKKKWKAQICLKRTQYNLGTYDNIEDAAKARKEAEEKLFKPVLKKYNEGKINESKQKHNDK